MSKHEKTVTLYRTVLSALDGKLLAIVPALPT